MGANKKTYKMIVKERSRKVITQFIRRNFGNCYYKKCLFLPGKECNDLIWLNKLGFRAENIFGLEEDSTTYSILEGLVERDKQFVLLPRMSLKELAENWSKYLEGSIDFFWLDLQCTLAGTVESLSSFIRQGRMADNYAVSITTTAARTYGETSAWLNGFKVLSKDGELQANISPPAEEVRDRLTRTQLEAILTNGNPYGFLEKVILDPYVELVQQNLEEGKDSQNCNSLWKGITNEVLFKWAEKKAKTGLACGTFSKGVEKQIQEKFDEWFLMYIKLVGGKVTQPSLFFEQSTLLRRCTQFFLMGAGITKDARSLKYIGDGGTPMYVDLFFVSKPVDYYKRIGEMLNTSTSSFFKMFSPIVEGVTSSYDPLDKYSKICHSMWSLFVQAEDLRTKWLKSSRQNLGSETRVQKKLCQKLKQYRNTSLIRVSSTTTLKENVINKTLEERKAMAKALLKLDSHLSSVIIGKKVGLTKMQVASLRAWNTMREKVASTSSN